MTVAGDRLDRLVEVGLISGYTREESVGHLSASRGEIPGSWVYRDVRSTGTATRRTGTINAHAHVTSQGNESFVVLSTDSCPPLPGMSVTSLHLLDCWESLLGDMEREAAG